MTSVLDILYCLPQRSICRFKFSISLAATASDLETICPITHSDFTNKTF